MALSLRVAARAWIFKLYRVVFLYSGFLVYLFELSVQDRRGGPTASHFLYSLRSPYGTPFRRAANYAVYSKKSNQKCRKLNGEA